MTSPTVEPIWIVFRDDEVWGCYKNYDEADAALELCVRLDTDQSHTWSLAKFELLGT